MSPKQPDKLLLKILCFQAEANGIYAIIALVSVVVMLLGYLLLTRV